MEGGNGTADVLTGKEVFQGKLTDTIAKKITDYPADKNHGGKEKNVYQEDIYVGYRYFETFARDTVLYPFGYGLSYTEFSISDSGISRYKNAYVLEAGTYRFHAGANVRNRGRTDKRHSQLAAGKYTSARTVVCKAVLNGEELVTFQTNGTNGRWNLQKLLRVRLEAGCNQITLQLPKPGMEIDFTAFQKC